VVLIHVLRFAQCHSIQHTLHADVSEDRKKEKKKRGKKGEMCIFIAVLTSSLSHVFLLLIQKRLVNNPAPLLRR
jgi:hypothetical protein